MKESVGEGGSERPRCGIGTIIPQEWAAGQGVCHHLPLRSNRAAAHLIRDILDGIIW
jgi:hypothetical protein